MGESYLPRETDCNGVPLLPDTQRLDVIWQQLIAELDALRNELESWKAEADYWKSMYEKYGKDET